MSRAKDEVRSVLSQLGRIALDIRRSGTRARLQRADQLFPLKDNRDPQDLKDSQDLQDLQDLKVHLTTLLLSRPPFSGDRPETLRELSEVQARLVKCNLIRRHRFLYAQKHKQRLTPALMPAAKPQVALEEKCLETASSLVRAEATEVRARRDGAAEEDGKPVAGTETAASALSDSFALHDVPAAQAATTQVSTTAARLTYPKAPSVNDEKDFFSCPCCCQTLPVMMSEGNRWRWVLFSLPRSVFSFHFLCL